MEHFKPAFNSLIDQLRKTASFTVTFFVLFIYQVVLDEHLKCSCKDGVKPEVTCNQCIIYMLFPALILFLLTLWMDGEFQRVLRIIRICGCNLWRRFFAMVFKAVAIGSLWVVSVLFDGDWYVCLKRVMLPCRNNTTPFQEELEKQLEARFKTESMVIGLVLVLVLLVVTSILTAVPWRDVCSVILRKCTRCQNIKDCNTIKMYHMMLYEESILEEIDIVIEKELKRTAKESVVLKIRELLPPSSTAATQGGDGASSSTTNPEVEDSRSSSTTNPEVEDSRSSSTTNPEVEDSRSSSTTNPEVEDRGANNLDFDKMSKLYSKIIRSMFPGQTHSRNDNLRSGQVPLFEEGPQP